MQGEWPTPRVTRSALLNRGKQMKTAHKVTIGSCDPGSVNGSFAYRLIQLAQSRSSRLGPFVRIKGSGLLSKQRNRMVKQFLDNTKSDWLLMLDSDEQLSVPAFDALIDTAHDKERPIVAALSLQDSESLASLTQSQSPAYFRIQIRAFFHFTNTTRTQSSRLTQQEPDACSSTEAF